MKIIGMRNEIEQILEKIKGKSISKIIAGGSNGSIIVIHFDDSKYIAFIKCVWRLDSETQVLTGWNESNEAVVGVMTRRVIELEEDNLENYELSSFFDLKLMFRSKKTLNIFCDVTPNYEPEGYDENWIICDVTSNSCYTISRNFEVLVTKFK